MGPLLATILGAGLLLGGCDALNPAPYQSRPGFPSAQSSADFSAALFKELNRYRNTEGYKGLAWDPTLAQLAAEHSLDMAQRAEMDHAGFKDRYQSTGYSLCVENVASSAGSALEVLGMWRNSPGHNANMLNADIRRVGVARSGRFITMLACRP